MDVARVRVRGRGDYNLEKLIEESEELNGKTVRVSVMGSEHLRMIATVHEYGCMIAVTPKMRAFLGAKGLHLKKTTSHINIPERSFIRNGWDSNERVILKYVEGLVGDMAELKKDAKEVASGTGLETSEKIQEFAIYLDNPMNHPFTIEQKGFDDPLIDSGTMIGAIDYEVI